MKVALALLLVLAGPVAAGQDVAQRESDLDRRTREVASQLRCPVCQGLSINDSPAELAIEMKGVVREQLAAGKTPADHSGHLARGDSARVTVPTGTVRAIRAVCDVDCEDLGLTLFDGEGKQLGESGKSDHPELDIPPDQPRGLVLEVVMRDCVSNSCGFELFFEK